jgi:hypothetical protein
MTRYPNPLYDQFTSELNLQLRPQETNIQMSPYLIFDSISPSNTKNMKFQLILRWFAYYSLRVMFLW